MYRDQRDALMARVAMLEKELERKKARVEDQDEALEDAGERLDETERELKRLRKKLRRYEPKGPKSDRAGSRVLLSVGLAVLAAIAVGAMVFLSASEPDLAPPPAPFPDVPAGQPVPVPAPEPSPHPPTPKAEKSGCSATIVEATFRAHVREVAHCAPAEAAGDPESERVELSLTIGPDGRATSVKVWGRDADGTAIESCLRKAMTDWEFAPPRDGSCTVSYLLEY